MRELAITATSDGLELRGAGRTSSKLQQRQRRQWQQQRSQTPRLVWQQQHSKGDAVAVRARAAGAPHRRYERGCYYTLSAPATTTGNR